jgi:hypothetical protein
MVQSQPWANKVTRSYLENTHHKKGLEWWLKVLAMSSNPSTAKKKKKDLVQLSFSVLVLFHLPLTFHLYSP